MSDSKEIIDAVLTPIPASKLKDILRVDVIWTTQDGQHNSRAYPNVSVVFKDRDD